MSKKSISFVIVILMAAIWTVVVSRAAVIRHLNFHSNLWDLGWLEQVVWNTTQGNFLHASIRGMPTESYLTEHISFVPVVLSPVYRLLPETVTLLAAQTVMLGLGGIVLFQLAHVITGRVVSAFLIFLSYLVSPLVINVALFDLHYISFVVPLLMVAFYGLLSGKTKLTLLSVALALLVKEEVAITVFAFGVMARIWNRRRIARQLMSLAVFYLVVVTLFNHYVMPLGPLTDRIDSRYPLDLSQHQEIVDLKLKYVIGSLGMFGFLPFFGGAAFIPSVPALLYNTASTFIPQLTWSYQYSAVLIAPLFVSTIFGIDRVVRALEARFTSRKAGLNVLISGTLLLLSMTFFSLFGNKYILLQFLGPEVNARRQLRNYAVDMIPEGASVSAGNSVGAHLSQRQELYDFPRYPFRAEWVIFDTWNNVDQGFEGKAFYRRQLSELNEHGFQLVADYQGVLVYKKGI